MKATAIAFELDFDDRDRVNEVALQLKMRYPLYDDANAGPAARYIVAFPANVLVSEKMTPEEMFAGLGEVCTSLGIRLNRMVALPFILTEAVGISR